MIKHNLFVRGAAALAIAALCRTAAAQEVFTGLGSWGAAGAPPALPSDSLSGMVTGVTTDVDFWGPGLVVQLGKSATVTNVEPSPGGLEDSFRLFVVREQSFTLGEASTLTIPIFLNGSTSVNGVSGFRFGEAHARVQIIDSTNTPVALFSLDWSTVNTGIVNDFKYIEHPLTMGSYRVRSVLEIAGESADSLNDPGASIDVDFDTGVSGGMATSIGAYPAGLTSSRDIVNAPAARGAEFGFVDGSGIEVGLLEAGNPYLSHVSLAGKIAVNHGDLHVAGTTDYRREHALATSGIIAGDDVSDDNAGIAPGATIRSAPISSYSGGFSAALSALMTANPAMKVINMSFTTGTGSIAADVATVESTVNANPNLTFVKSSGNAGTPGSVSTPGQAYNGITVGGVDRAHGGRGYSSSYGTASGLPMKPDIVAPSEFVNAPLALDTNADAMPNDFGRNFLGDDFRYTIAQAGAGANANRILGTSFAAPHVAGAAALLYDFQNNAANVATHEADHRVIKAVLLNAANTNVTHFGGGAWSQVTTGSMPGLVVSQSLDQEVGAGMLDVVRAMRQYKPDEINASDSNLLANFNIASPLATSDGWDLEQVPAGGRVNYLLGDIVGNSLRATLTWDFVSATSTLEPLELRLYEESPALGNPLGWDPADLLLAGTSAIGENVKLLDLLPLADFNGSGLYFLQVINFGGTTTTYGIAAHVPEPGALMSLTVILIGVRRRR